MWTQPADADSWRRERRELLVWVISALLIKIALLTLLWALFFRDGAA